MILQLVSMTGADDMVDPAELLALSIQYPLVEWAILSSQKREGTARYPSESWVETFHAVCPNVQKAIHLCGRDVDDFLAEDARILAKVRKFDRIQLNFNQRAHPKNLDVLARVANSIEQTIIVQHNSANAMLWQELHDKVNRLTVLFDASGGRGVVPEGDWPPIFPNTVCGYAGGLGPDNVREALPAIAKQANGNPCWIDMESKLRTDDDRFSLAACSSVLAQTSYWLAPPL